MLLGERWGLGPVLVNPTELRFSINVMKRQFIPNLNNYDGTL